MESGNGPRPGNATPGGANARDLGYLEKFLDKLRAQAAAMPRGDARTRLEVLLREESDRWREIATLLGGAPSETPATARGPVPNAASTVRPEWKPRATIGSLKGTAR